jgi:sarcosine oxidase subunit beta
MRVSEQASVVVIGGGAIGVAAAYELAAAGVRDVVLIDSGPLGGGSTSKSAGGVRAQFSDRVNIELAARSLETFEHFGERLGQDIDLRQPGYLFLLDAAADVAAFDDSTTMLQAMGVASRMLDVAEARRMSPLIAADGLLGACYTPSGGYCAPESVVLGYATAARRLGARLLPHRAATGIVTAGRQVTAVTTDAGPIATPAVICAAGAWSRHVGEWAGVDLPVTPLRRQILVTEPLSPSLARGLPDSVPFTIDFGTSFYFHREGPGMLLGMSDPDETPGFKLGRDDAWLPRLGTAIERRAPALAAVGIAVGWAGLYEVTPDHNGLIGVADGADRFIYATGFSGHGFLMSPALGEVIRDLYRGRQPFTDVSGLDARRFATTGPRPERAIV